MSGSDLRFYLVDVFTTEPLNGNPLAVVVGGQNLSLEVMQRIAREFNQSETTFILAPTRGDANWRLRSFTPTGAEVFGVGHNALGAWWWLAESGRLKCRSGRKAFVQEIGEGIFSVIVNWEAKRPTSVAMEQAPSKTGCAVEDFQGLAGALGLDLHDLVTEHLPTQVVSTGAAHLLVPLRSWRAVDRVRANAEALLSILQSVHGQGCYVFSLDVPTPGTNAYARFFNPTAGISEDPATGSAAGPLACHLAAHGVVQRNGTIVVEQGTAMGRRSLIHAHLNDGVVQIFGAGVVVARGILQLKSTSGKGPP